MPEDREAFRAYLRTGEVSPELRAMGDSGTGGFLFPAEYQAELTVALKSYANLVADMSPVETDHGRPVKFPVRAYAGSGTSTAGVLVSENPGSAIAANDAVYTGGTLNAWTFSSGVHQISMQLEQDSGIPIEDVVRDFSAEAIGRALSTYSVSGTGSSQPLGVIPACNTQGVWSAGASGGFVALGVATVAPTVTNASGTELGQNVLSVQSLSAMVNAVDPAYYPSSKFYMSAAQWSSTLLLADSQKRPFAAFTDGLEKTLLTFPVEISNEIPALVASTVGGPCFGSMSKGFYYRSAGFEVLRLSELKADSLGVAYIGYHRADLQVRDARAFVTVKAAAT